MMAKLLVLATILVKFVAEIKIREEAARATDLVRIAIYFLSLRGAKMHLVAVTNLLLI